MIERGGGREGEEREKDHLCWNLSGGEGRHKGGGRLENPEKEGGKEGRGMKG